MVSSQKWLFCGSSRRLGGLLGGVDGRILDADNHDQIKIWLLAHHAIPLDYSLSSLTDQVAIIPREILIWKFDRNCPKYEHFEHCWLDDHCSTDNSTVDDDWQIQESRSASCSGWSGDHLRNFLENQTTQIQPNGFSGNSSLLSHSFRIQSEVSHWWYGRGTQFRRLKLGAINNCSDNICERDHCLLRIIIPS